MKEIKAGQCYLDGAGDIMGPMIRDMAVSLNQPGYHYYFIDDDGIRHDYTKLGRYYKDGTPSEGDLNLSLDIAIDEPDEPDWGDEGFEIENVTGYTDKDGIYHCTGTLKNKNGPKKKAPSAPKPLPVVQPLPPRRRVLNMNHGQAAATIKAPDPWKILSIYEDDDLLVVLSEIQHVEKLKTCRTGEIQPDGLHVITSLTKRDPICDMWTNPCHIPESKAAAFLYQFKKYREDVENPQRVIEMVAEELGKKHAPKKTKSGTEFKYADAMMEPPQYHPLFEDDDDINSPF